MKKLVLVNPWKMIYPPLGLGYIASYLDKYLKSINIEIIDSSENLKEKIIRSRPDVLGFTSSTPNYFEVVDLIKEVKKCLDVPIILGGPHITSLPHKLSEHVDVGVIGEGEETMLELMKLFDEKGDFANSELQKIKGIVYHDNGENIITPPRELIEPIDKIPFPNRSLFDMSNYLRPADILVNHEYLRGTSMLTSRGCPYRCIYCQVPQQWRKLRLHSAEYVAREIKLLVDEYKLEGIAIVDDLFIVNTERIERLIELLEEYEILGKVKFLVDGRSNLIDEKLLALLKRLNVVQMALGIESGSERVLNYLKRGSVTAEQNRNAVHLAKKYGIGIYGQFMMGTPTETKEEMLETLKFIREQPLRSVHLSITTPLPGSELWDYCKKEGIVTDDMDWRLFNMEPQDSVENNFYIDKQVPYEEFLNIFRQTQRQIKYKHLRNTPLKTLYKNGKYAILHPMRTCKFVYRFLRKSYR
ncbi:MAG TPA: B12-binding domain-containing radical SAM protein [Dehalococcoidia bacterium]|nr:B12-binding domain-containing radical SAM protein [Dehalococcoidia bacterium]